MDFEQYQSLPQRNTPKPITASDLDWDYPRTLLYGYDCDRNSWHVYLGHDGIIRLVVYAYPDRLRFSLTESQVSSNEGYVPNKRLYPECCDYEFCAKLRDRGVDLPFTTFNHLASRQFYGLLLEDVKATNNA